MKRKNESPGSDLPEVKIENWGGLEYVTVTTRASRVTSHGPSLSAEKMESIDLSIAKLIIGSRHPIRGKELNFIRKVCGISLRQLAEDFKVTHPTIINWEKSEERLDLMAETVIRIYFGEKMGLQINPSMESLAPSTPDTDEILLTA
jgi:DNA-binding transcriptional regulator YiaG